MGLLERPSLPERRGCLFIADSGQNNKAKLEMEDKSELELSVPLCPDMERRRQIRPESEQASKHTD